VKAAELDTSVSALVKRYLADLAAGETEFQCLVRLEREARARVPVEFRAADNLPRDELYVRGWEP